MKQVVQSYKAGDLRMPEVPVPTPKRSHLHIHTAASLVSVGPEKSMLELARKSLLDKALARPDLIRQLSAKSRDLLV